jgi:hypothetical protein
MNSLPQPSVRANESGPKVGRRSLHAMIAVLLGLLGLPAAALAVPALLPAASANGVPLVAGDVLAATGNGIVSHFNNTGTLLDSLNNGTSATYTTGMCFDTSKDLFVTNFDSDSISEFSSAGNLLNATWATTPTGVNANPATAESCTINAANDMYVGGPGSADIYEFNPSGTLINTYPVTGGSGTGGTDWVDLSADQCTILYTGEGAEILSYNVCTHTQNPDFATGLPAPCYELRVLPATEDSGGVMVACASEAERFNTSGVLVQTYPIAGSSSLFSLNLDPDLTTFWTGDSSTGEVYRVNIATGAAATSFPSNPAVGLFGLSIVGGIVVGQPTITVTPPTGTNNTGTPYTVTATITNPGGSVSGQTVDCSVTGANTVSLTPETTNGSGQATFTYTGTNAGGDTITCTFGTATGTATVTWTTGAKGCKPVVKHVFPIGDPRLEIVRVEILGDCFTGATKVTFGSVAGTFAVNSGGAILTSPPQQPAGTVDVTVTGPGGTSALNPPADQYRYYLPQIDQVLPNFGPVAGGNTVLIRGFGFSGTPAPTVKFGGTSSSSVVVTSDGIIHAVVPPHIGKATVDIQVTTFAGTSLPTPADHYTYK